MTERPVTFARLSRLARLPDPVRLARFRRAPDLGPRVLFFSGGSALHQLCRRLIDHTHNSIHVITTFDSGGSSAVLRRAFGMPAVGDIRNRLMSLADPGIQGNPQVARLFAHRLPTDQDAQTLAETLARLVAGRHPLVAATPDPLRKIIRQHLARLAQALPADFDLRGASLGNLTLCGGYLDYDRHLDPVIFMFSKMAEVRGVVRPVLNADLHLAAELADGRLIVGQHLLTGRQGPALSAPIQRLYLCAGLDDPRPARAAVRQKLLDHIGQAELICFPMGSFYTSVVANLLPEGVRQTVAQAPCPKVYVPNLAGDPEQIGMTLSGAVATLLAYLGQGQPPGARPLDLVLIDSRLEYPGGRARPEELRELGVDVIDAPLASDPTAKTFDPDCLLGVLLSLI